MLRSLGLCQSGWGALLSRGNAMVVGLAAPKGLDRSTRAIARQPSAQHPSTETIHGNPGGSVESTGQQSPVLPAPHLQKMWSSNQYGVTPVFSQRSAS
jgi:hypothetical protein